MTGTPERLGAVSTGRRASPPKDRTSAYFMWGAELPADRDPALRVFARLAGRLAGDREGFLRLVGPDGMESWVNAAGSTTVVPSAVRSRCEAPITVVVPDTHLDRLCGSDCASSDTAEVRFYAGTPLTSADGRMFGTVCVVDFVPGDLSAAQREDLVAVASQVAEHVELRAHASEVSDLRVSHAAQAEDGWLIKALVQQSDAMIYAKDLEGRFLFANPALHRLLGRGAGGLGGRTDHDLFPELVADALRGNDVAVGLSGQRQVFDEQLPGVDGSVRDYRSTKFPLRDTQGRIFAVASVSTDVTELARHGRDEAVAKQRWRGLVENSPVPVVVFDAHGRFAYVNPLAAALYGAPAAELIGRSSREITPPEVLGGVEARIASVLDGEQITGQRRTLRRLDGQVLHVELNATRVDYRGEAAIQVELHDVSEQVGVETALRESEARWRNLVEGSPVGIGLSDERGMLIAVNPALCAVLGRSESELLGRLGAELAHPDDRHPHRRPSELIGGAPTGVVSVERRFLRPDGEIRWVWLTATHTVGPQGQVWTIAHVQDITDRRAGEQATAESQANLSAVAAVIKRIQVGADARQSIVDAAVDLAHAEYAALLEPAASGAVLRVSATTDPKLLGNELPLSETSATGEAFRTGEAVFIRDVASHPLVQAAPDRPTYPESLYLVPVRSADATTAVLLVAWEHQIPSLDDRRAAVVTLLADQAGVALRQAMLLHELETLALTDQLTGLPNRRGWEQQLDLLLGAAHRSGAPLTVALADIDHFKRFNDIRGHLAGDELLQQLAVTGRAALRASDILARWGGEEFAIALPNCPPAEALEALARLQCAIPEHQSCSIGFAVWDGTETVPALMDRADRALYAAKRAGRQRIQAAESSDKDDPG